jgi:hypothetical protein
VNGCELIISADLGSSSSYSNELRYVICMQSNVCHVEIALKAVVGKVSLRVALMQGLVGPKCLEKFNI